MSDKKFRVVKTEDHEAGRRRYFIEFYGYLYSSFNPFETRKRIREKDWRRIGSPYVYDDKEEAIRRCKELVLEKEVIYTGEGE